MAGCFLDVAQVCPGVEGGGDVSSVILPVVLARSPRRQGASPQAPDRQLGRAGDHPSRLDRPDYERRVAQISRRAEFLAQLAGELLAILLGLWMVFGLGWEEFGPGLVLFGTIGLVVTSVRMWKGRGQPADDDAGARDAAVASIDDEPPRAIGPVT
jgi:hypothetical protein